MLTKNDAKGLDVAISNFDVVQHSETSEYHTNSGTLGYMSPEVLDSGRYGVRGDLWSLGVTMIELMKGGKVMHNIAFKLNCKEAQENVHSQIRKLLDAREEYSSELIEMVLKMISFTPVDRGTSKEIYDWCIIQTEHSSIGDKEALDFLTAEELEKLHEVYRLDAEVKEEVRLHLD